MVYVTYRKCKRKAIELLFQRCTRADITVTSSVIVSSSIFRCRNKLTARSSAIVERPHDSLCQLKCCQLLRNCTKNRTLKGVQGRQNCHYSIDHTRFPISDL